MWQNCFYEYNGLNDFFKFPDGDCPQLENDLLSLELVKPGKEGPEYYRNGANVKVMLTIGHLLVLVLWFSARAKT